MKFHKNLDSNLVQKIQKFKQNQVLKLVGELCKKEKKLFELQNKLAKIEENERQNWQKNIDPKILKTFAKLGISLEEQKRLVGVEQIEQKVEQNSSIESQNLAQILSLEKSNNSKTVSNISDSILNLASNLSTNNQQNIRQTAVDVVLDSVSIRTTFEEDLAKLGIIFCPISKAIINFPDLVRKYFGSVVPVADNFFACLNSAVFSEGTFVYIPPGVVCPMDLSTYFRINAENTGQFERTLIIADVGSQVSYLEGCTAPEQKQNQLHAAVVELIALEGAEIKYSTVQNWFAGKNGVGGVYNLVTKRGICHKNAKISWTQVETGSSVTWKYPSVVLKGENSVGQFYSIAITKDCQQADTGSKMIHQGFNSKSQIISKSISQDQTSNTYRGLVKIAKNADNCYNFTSCDSLILEKNDKNSIQKNTLQENLNGKFSKNLAEELKSDLEINLDQNQRKAKTIFKMKNPKKKNSNWAKIEKIIHKLTN